MGIMDFLGQVRGAKDDARMYMADKLGLTKSMIDEGDGSEYQVIDDKAFNDTADSFAKTAAALAKMPEMKSGVIAPSQVYSSPAPVSGQSPNPYQAVNYGTMPYQPQQMGGIGSAPSMEEILKALQARSV